MKKLSKHQERILARFYLGGIDAIRTKTFSAKCKALDILVKAGYFDVSTNRAVLSDKGKEIAKQLADSGII